MGESPVDCEHNGQKNSVLHRIEQHREILFDSTFYKTYKKYISQGDILVNLSSEYDFFEKQYAWSNNAVQEEG